MEKSLVIKKKTKLTKGQTSLYLLILKKIENDSPITFQEAKDLYFQSARDVRDGVPCFFNYWWRNEKDERVGRWQPLSDYEIATRTMMWLTHNIGALVLKGCLKVIPQIDVDEIKALV